MGYLSNELKATIKANVKNVCAKHGIKATVSVEGGMTPVLNVNIKSGAIDFINNYNETYNSKLHGHNPLWSPAENHIDVNTYHFTNQFNGKALDFLRELNTVINEGNHDNSDSQSDYFDVGWYSRIHVGHWHKPYQLAA